MAEEFAELNKQEIAFIYKQKCDEAGIDPHVCFMNYLEETMEEVEALEVVIKGNDKINFNSRLTDQAVICLCSALEQFSIYIEDIDLRYNEITDEGA